MCSDTLGSRQYDGVGGKVFAWMDIHILNRSDWGTQSGCNVWGRLFAAEISDLVGTAQKMSAAGLRFQASSGLEASSTVQAEDDQGDGR